MKLTGYFKQPTNQPIKNAQLTDENRDEGVERAEEVVSNTVSTLIGQLFPTVLQLFERWNEHAGQDALHGMQQSPAVSALTIGVQHGKVDLLWR